MHTSFLTALAASTFLVKQASAHSWVEMLRNVANNGTFMGDPGYPRGYFNRSAPGFNDKTMAYQVEQNGANPSMCMGTQQGGLPQTPGAPRLQASVGSMIALLYQENGHVTLPQNVPGKPANRGTVYVYVTDQPHENETFYSIHKIWNADGTGGDKRGKLLTTQNFDDGQCYQKNDGTISTTRQKEFNIIEATLPEGGNLWCQTDLAIPSDAQSGKPLALYWVWDWPTSVGTAGQPNGMNQTYTTCMDVDVVNGSSNSKVAAAPIKYVPNSDIQGAGVPAAVNQMAQGTNFFAQTSAVNGFAPGAAPGPATAAASSAPVAPGQTTQAAAVPPVTTPAGAQTQPTTQVAAGTSLVINPVPTGTMSAATSSAACAAAPSVATTSAAALPTAPASGAPALSVSIVTVTVFTNSPVATASVAPAAVASTAALLSEASASGSAGAVAPEETAPVGAASASSAPAEAAATQSSAAAPSQPCKPSGVQKRSLIFAEQEPQEQPKLKRSTDLVEEPLEEALALRVTTRSKRRSARFNKKYTH
ncbi:MAG: hypothetical protein LQ340_001064 [Diploschistes diacapsis]|nr:MAG: hypothetical protein LQ340_001064 [Diploschistes diacapsis]